MYSFVFFFFLLYVYFRFIHVVACCNSLHFYFCFYYCVLFYELNRLQSVQLFFRWAFMFSALGYGEYTFYKHNSRCVHYVFECVPSSRMTGLWVRHVFNFIGNSLEFSRAVVPLYTFICNILEFQLLHFLLPLVLSVIFCVILSVLQVSISILHKKNLRFPFNIISFSLVRELLQNYLQFIDCIRIGLQSQ